MSVILNWKLYLGVPFLKIGIKDIGAAANCGYTSFVVLISISLRKKMRVP